MNKNNNWNQIKLKIPDTVNNARYFLPTQAFAVLTMWMTSPVSIVLKHISVLVFIYSSSIAVCRERLVWIFQISSSFSWAFNTRMSREPFSNMFLCFRQNVGKISWFLCRFSRMEKANRFSLAKNSGNRDTWRILLWDMKTTKWLSTFFLSHMSVFRELVCLFSFWSLNNFHMMWVGCGVYCLIVNACP